jgi:hypothetical protein
MADKKLSFDLTKLNTREIVILLVTILAAVGYGFYEYEYSVQIVKFKKLERENRKAQDSVNSLQRLLINPSQIKKTQKQINKLKNEIQEIQTSITNTKNRLTGQDLKILNDLQSEADFYGVFLKSMKTTEKKISRAGLHLKEVSLIMKIECDFNSLKSFMGSLKNFPAVITIESLETERDEKLLPKLESRLHIKVIVL